MADWYADLSWLPANYRLHVYAAEGTLDAPGNKSDVRCIGWIEKKTGSGYFTGNGDATFSAAVNGSTVTSGAWSPYDFTAYSSKLLFDVTVPVTHNPDGSKTVAIAVSVHDPNNMGSASVSQNLPLTTLKVAPGTPTGLACTYVSDSLVDMAWTNNYQSNGAPTQNRIQSSVNGGAFADLVTIAAANGASVGTAANRKTVYQVRASNTAGSSAYSSTATLYTTPAAPTGVAAAKDASLDITVSWTPNVGFSEHTHVVEHGTVTGGVTTWDGSVLATVTAGTSTYKHTSPNPAQIHVYRVYAKNTDTGALTSSKVASNQVQLLVAPDAPTFGTVPAYANKAADLVVPWVHNPVDTTPQSAYEFSYSTNGGGSWSSTGKVTSTTSSRTIPASTYAANDELTVRVRTWGQATTGGSDGTGASPWSTTKLVTFKTRPTISIMSPADSSTVDEATLTVALSFAQAESASFVQATLGLYDGATLLESRTTTTLAGTTFDTKVLDGGEYTITATALDSNGLTAAEASNDFDVAYTLPVAAVVAVTYLDDSGIGQLAVTIPAAGVGEEDAAAVTITRTIDTTEVVLEQYPVTVGAYTFLDLTPTIHGTNTYTVTTFSSDGATADTVEVLVTVEDAWAFLNSGAGFAQVVKFAGNLLVGSVPSRQTALVAAAGRRSPIALFGENRSMAVSGTALLATGEGSTVEEIETFLLDAGRVCYRDPSGRRLFGSVQGSFSGRTGPGATFSYTVSEAT